MGEDSLFCFCDLAQSVCGKVHACILAYSGPGHRACRDSEGTSRLGPVVLGEEHIVCCGCGHVLSSQRR